MYDIREKEIIKERDENENLLHSEITETINKVDSMNIDDE
jgi:hypothetical protein